MQQTNTKRWVRYELQAFLRGIELFIKVYKQIVGLTSLARGVYRFQ
jgi:hypothetical protein